MHTIESGNFGLMDALMEIEVKNAVQILLG